MEQTQLIRLCQKGDAKAFEILVHQYSRMLMAICVRYMKDQSAAKDALQECLISIFRGIGKYKHEGNFEGWMKRIAVNSSLKELRKKKNSYNSLTLVNDIILENAFEEPIILESLNLEAVMIKINELPEDYRIAFNLYVVEGYSYQEIANLLQTTEVNCRMKVSRARKKLHTILLKDQDYHEFKRTRKVD